MASGPNVIWSPATVYVPEPVLQPVSTATFVPARTQRRPPHAGGDGACVERSTIESSNHGAPSRPSGAVPPSGAARSTNVTPCPRRSASACHRRARRSGCDVSTAASHVSWSISAAGSHAICGHRRLGDDEHVALQGPRRRQLVAAAGGADVGAVERQLDLGAVDQLEALDRRRQERAVGRARSPGPPSSWSPPRWSGAASVPSGPAVASVGSVSAEADGLGRSARRLGSSSSSPHAASNEGDDGREGERAANVHHRSDVRRPSPCSRGTRCPPAASGQNRGMAVGREALFPTGVTILRALAVARWLAWGWMVAVVAFSGDAIRQPVAAWAVRRRGLRPGGDEHLARAHGRPAADGRRLPRRRGRPRPRR